MTSLFAKPAKKLAELPKSCRLAIFPRAFLLPYFLAALLPQGLLASKTSQHSKPRTQGSPNRRIFQHGVPESQRSRIAQSSLQHRFLQRRLLQPRFPSRFRPLSFLLRALLFECLFRMSIFARKPRESLRTGSIALPKNTGKAQCVMNLGPEFLFSRAAPKPRSLGLDL